MAVDFYVESSADDETLGITKDFSSEWEDRGLVQTHFRVLKGGLIRAVTESFFPSDRWEVVATVVHILLLFLLLSILTLLFFLCLFRLLSSFFLLSTLCDRLIFLSADTRRSAIKKIRIEGN